MKKILRSFVYAFNGLRILLQNETNAKVHIIIVVCVVILGFILKISKYEWIAVVFACGLVISAETFNTAIEKTINKISPDYNKQAGEIKDLAAAAVLVCAVASIIIGFIIFLPKILHVLTLININL